MCFKFALPDLTILYATGSIKRFIAKVSGSSP